MDQDDKAFCDRDKFKAILSDLDEQWTSTLAKQIRRSVRRTRPARMDVEKSKMMPVLLPQEGSQLPHSEDLDVHVIVAEVYSPPRMCEMVEKLGMKCGFSLDLTTKDENGQAWDFSQQHFRAKALKLLDEEKPMLLVVCPPCTMSSTMQNVNIVKMDAADVKMRTEAAVSHFAFALLLCIRQSQAGRKFVIEHPVGASSWALRLTNLLAQCPGTRNVNLDFCMLGMKSSDDQGEAPAKNRTKVMTNSDAIAATLETYKCNGLHRQVALEH